MYTAVSQIFNKLFDELGLGYLCLLALTLARLLLPAGVR